MIVVLTVSVREVWNAGNVGLGTVMSSSEPLGPNDIDVDEVRSAACDATAPSRVCDPPREPDPPPDLDPPDVGGESVSGLGALGQLLVVVLVAALVAALAWMVWKFVSERSVRDEIDDDEDLDEDEDLDDELGPRIVDDERPPDRWRRAAAEHRARSEFRDSVRCEYRALVGDLARAGYVDEIPGRTSGEERVQVAAIAPTGSDVPDRFSDAADRFDVAWFDDQPVTGDDDAAFVDAANAVLDTVLAGARSGSRRAAQRGGG